MLLWYRLPLWAPEWVEAHSPWLEPILRAGAARAELDSVLDQRLAHWPESRGAELCAALAHPDLRVRWVAACALTRYPDAAAAPLLLGELASADGNLAEAACAALVADEDPGITGVICAGLDQVGGRAHERLLDWLTRCGDWRALPGLAAELVPWQGRRRSPTGSLSMEFARTVERIRAGGWLQHAADAFAALLADARPRGRLTGVLGLVAIGERACDRDLSGMLIDPALEVREFACSELLSLSAADDGRFAPLMPWLAGLLAQQPGASRAALARFLAQARDPRAVEALARVVRSGWWDAPTRLQAIIALDGSGSTRAISALAEVVTGMPGADGPRARQLAAHALGAAQGAVAAGALVAACADPAAEVRLEGVVGLARNRAVSADAVLLLTLGDADDEVRAAAVEGIARLGHAAGVAVLLAAVEERRHAPGGAEAPADATPLWRIACDELGAPGRRLEDGQRALLAAVAGWSGGQRSEAREEPRAGP